MDSITGLIDKKSCVKKELVLTRIMVTISHAEKLLCTTLSKTCLIKIIEKKIVWKTIK